MTDKLFELGEIGVLQDIPQEMISLANDNNVLKQENTLIKTRNRILIILLVGLTTYLIYRHFNKKQYKDHDFISFKYQ